MRNKKLIFVVFIISFSLIGCFKDMFKTDSFGFGRLTSKDYPVELTNNSSTTISAIISAYAPDIPESSYTTFGAIISPHEKITLIVDFDKIYDGFFKDGSKYSSYEGELKLQFESDTLQRTRRYGLTQFVVSENRKNGYKTSYKTANATATVRAISTTESCIDVSYKQIDW